MRFLIIIAIATALLAIVVEAQERLSDRETFVSRVAGQDLSRFGISLTVTPEGGITGTAFGSEVTGSWTWKDGFFCREMSWGTRDWARNCQLVQIEGGRVRFVADRGEGESAYLSLP